MDVQSNQKPYLTTAFRLHALHGYTIPLHGYATVPRLEDFVDRYAHNFSWPFPTISRLFCESKVASKV